MRRKREPGTRNPFELPVVEATDDGLLADFQILAASPVVNTVFYAFVHPLLARGQSHESGPGNVSRETSGTGSSLICLSPSSTSTSRFDPYRCWGVESFRPCSVFAFQFRSRQV